jgi:hypothetical protein
VRRVHETAELSFGYPDGPAHEQLRDPEGRDPQGEHEGVRVPRREHARRLPGAYPPAERAEPHGFGRAGELPQARRLDPRRHEREDGGAGEGDVHDGAADREQLLAAPGRALPARAVHGRLEALEPAGAHGREERALVGEVAVDGRVRDPEARGERLQGEPLRAALRLELPLGRVHEGTRQIAVVVRRPGHLSTVVHVARARPRALVRGVLAHWDRETS